MATAKKPTNNPDLVTRMVTPMFRLSHPHLFKAQAPKPTDKPKFSLTMLIPKKNKDGKPHDLMGSTIPVYNSAGELVEAGRPISLKEVIRNAKIQAYGAQENWPEELESPVGDGDDPHFHKKGEKEGYRGHWVIKATSNQDQRPGVIDKDKTKITEANVIYPGCYCRASIYARRWEYMGKEGIQFILDNVQKMRDGESFGGKKTAEQTFSPIGDDEFEAPAEETEEMDFT